MNVLIVNGSPRTEGRTTLLTTWMANRFQSSFIDLSEIILPIFNGGADQYESKEVKMLINAVEEADAILIATPEYHGAMSGALKNALDFLNSSYFAHKPMGLIAVAGGGKGGINALNSVRTVARALYGNVLAKQLVIDPTDFTKGDDVITKQMASSIDELFAEVKMYAALSKKVLNEKQNV
ncbi:NAD(P)H-dependent oxidoreductase [Priestia megaterium]|nr:NAD(P)H-dependent oxidoreductase [Priestia megaterium]